MSTEEKECSLLTRTRDMLATNEASYLKVYMETGLSPNWLSQFANRKIKEPSVNKVQRLYEYLIGRELQV